MDVRHLLESDFVSVQMIKDSSSKKGIILSPGTEEQFKESKNLKLLIEIDGKKKFWKVNKTSLKLLVLQFGAESDKYVGIPVDFEIQIVNGRESVVGKPTV